MPRFFGGKKHQKHTWDPAFSSFSFRSGVRKDAGACSHGTHSLWPNYLVKFEEDIDQIASKNAGLVEGLLQMANVGGKLISFRTPHDYSFLILTCNVTGDAGVASDLLYANDALSVIVSASCNEVSVCVRVFFYILFIRIHLIIIFT